MRLIEGATMALRPDREKGKHRRHPEDEDHERDQDFQERESGPIHFTVACRNAGIRTSVTNVSPKRTIDPWG